MDGRAMNCRGQIRGWPPDDGDDNLMAYPAAEISVLRCRHVQSLLISKDSS